MIDQGWGCRVALDCVPKVDKALGSGLTTYVKLKGTLFLS